MSDEQKEQRLTKISKKTKNKNKKSHSTFDKSIYVLHFNSAFVEKDIGQEFHSFLKSEMNEEPWLFLMELKELQKSTVIDEFLSFSKKIIDHHILDKSKYEINLHGNTKTCVLDFFDFLSLENQEFDLKEAFDELFGSVEKIIRQELYHEPWKRFLRTKGCENLIKKYHIDSSVCSPQITEQFSYDDDYFRHPFIFDRDFDFAELLFRDTFQWELISVDSQSGMNTFYTPLNYLPQMTIALKCKAVKYECVLPVSLERLLLTYSSLKTVRESDPNITFVDTLDHYDYEALVSKFNENKWENEIGKFDRTLGVHLSHIVLPKPFNPRIFHHSRSMIYDAENEIISSVIKPYIYKDLVYSKPIKTKIHLQKDAPLKQKKVYPVFSFVFTRYQKIDEKKVLFSQVMVNDFGGWTTDPSIFKVVGKKRGANFRSSLLELVQKYPEDAKIEDYKESLCQEEDGKFIDGYGKLLYDLKIEEKRKNIRDSIRMERQKKFSQ
jgi:hypothetical protein